MGCQAPLSLLLGQDSASPSVSAEGLVQKNHGSEEVKTLLQGHRVYRLVFGQWEVDFSPCGYKSRGYILFSATRKMLFYEKGERAS